MNPLEVAERRRRIQDVYRGHDSPVVFIGFLPDACSMVTVDRSGKVLTWPATERARSGYGWFEPTSGCALPPTLPFLMPVPPPSDNAPTELPQEEDEELSEEDADAEEEEEAVEELVEAEVDEESEGSEEENGERVLWYVRYDWAVAAGDSGDGDKGEGEGQGAADAAGSMRLIQRRVERLMGNGSVAVAAAPFKIITSITDKDSSIKQTTQQVRRRAVTAYSSSER